MESLLVSVYRSRILTTAALYTRPEPDDGLLLPKGFLHGAGNCQGVVSDLSYPNFYGGIHTSVESIPVWIQAQPGPTTQPKNPTLTTLTTGMDFH